MRTLLFFSLLALSLRANDPGLQGPGLSIDLISENRSVTAGQAFTVGLHLHHFPGFHTYWRNPGMVGMATAIDWTLPEGFTASEIKWPYPENTFMAEYPCFGYERDVTLLVTVTPPKELTASEVTLKAETRWMCCAKGCFPGFKTFTLKLPVKDTPIPDATAKAHIAKAKTELPSTNHEVKATLLSKIDAPGIRIRFSNPGKLNPAQAHFFSNDRQISSDQKQEFISQKDGSLLLEIARAEFSPEGKSTIPGVLRINGKHLAVEAKPAN